MREGSQQQQRAVRAAVREERDGATGDEEPATKSRASTYQHSWKKDQGDGAEHGRPSTILREPGTSGAEAATERSEGVAGAERYQGPDPLNRRLCSINILPVRLARLEYLDRRYLNDSKL